MAGLQDEQARRRRDIGTPRDSVNKGMPGGPLNNPLARLPDGSPAPTSHLGLEQRGIVSAQMANSPNLVPSTLAGQQQQARMKQQQAAAQPLSRQRDLAAQGQGSGMGVTNPNQPALSLAGQRGAGVLAGLPQAAPQQQAQAAPSLGQSLYNAMSSTPAQRQAYATATANTGALPQMDFDPRNQMAQRPTAADTGGAQQGAIASGLSRFNDNYLKPVARGMGTAAMVANPALAAPMYALGEKLGIYGGAGQAATALQQGAERGGQKAVEGAAANPQGWGKTAYGANVVGRKTEDGYAFSNNAADVTAAGDTRFKGRNGADGRVSDKGTFNTMKSADMWRNLGGNGASKVFAAVVAVVALR